MGAGIDEASTSSRTEPGFEVSAEPGLAHKDSERDVCLGLLGRVNRHGPLTVIGDKGYAGRDFEAQAATLDVTIARPRRKDEPGRGPHLAPIRQRIESIYWTAKDILTLERHGARTLRGLRARIASRFLALAAAIALNHQLGRPPRALVDYTA
ncbi:MAG: transposase [Solirubrobacteraceae bacterium MAG38_C4-C5]|nr:transposase [Candidatus Siliceabacter maunaloa]